MMIILHIDHSVSSVTGAVRTSHVELSAHTVPTVAVVRFSSRVTLRVSRHGDRLSLTPPCITGERSILRVYGSLRSSPNIKFYFRLHTREIFIAKYALTLHRTSLKRRRPCLNGL